ncbi:MAG: hypothetical protein AM326_08390 [Candidatus Thorarchaeota archaeon SMTZ-45]|nr:MAG: hypothetical protein AM325_00650 [Candidatus Thorarchaeota archaeon SMTZ1-45]KXH75884.1 MAG: hypothetical protein AM326_08390 [Candidatus Thorarchaeota archaeon SMTZ-45]
MNSDKTVIEIDRDILQPSLICVAIFIIPIFFLFILPIIQIVRMPFSILVIWPLIVIFALYCLNRIFS